MEEGSDLTATRCLFSDNDASGGGAVYGAGLETRLSVEHCSLEGNSARREGGGLAAHTLGFLHMDRCVVCCVCVCAVLHCWDIGYCNRYGGTGNSVL